MTNPFKSIIEIFSKKSTRTMTTMLTSGMGGVVWPPDDYDNYAKETYLKNIIAFRCTFSIAQAISSVPWKLYRENEDGEKTEIFNHPINQILKRPNPYDSFNYLSGKIVSYLLMSGNTFIERVAPDSGPNQGMPMELYSLRPDKMKIKLNPETGAIAGYEYGNFGNISNFDVRPDGSCDILHIKLFNPTDELWGAAITTTAAREIDTSNAETEWNKKLLENECRPGMIFSMQGNLTPEQFDRLEKQLNDKFSGPSKVGKNLILEGDMKPDAKPYGWSPSEMDFIEGGREKARRIALAWGVPSMLLGIPGDNTYSNYAEARLAFWEETVIYYLDLFKNELNNWIFGQNYENLVIEYSLDNIPAFIYKREKLYTMANNATFLSVNEKRKLTGWEKVEGGDVIFVPANLLPLDMATTPPTLQDQNTQQQDDAALAKLIEKGLLIEEAEAIIGLAPKKNV